MNLFPLRNFAGWQIDDIWNSPSGIFGANFCIVDYTSQGIVELLNSASFISARLISARLITLHITVYSEHYQLRIIHVVV